MSDDQDIRDLLSTYERSLNTGDAELAAACYAADGQFMPTTLPTVTGPAMRDGYARLFGAIRLQVEFTIDELVVTSPGTAHALTRSHGLQTVLATGAVTTESNREVFLFVRQDGDWRISRYLFNKPE